MIGRRTTVGLSLLCALLFSALAVQSASATVAVNTTAVTCLEGKGDLDFTDPHCDNKVTPGEGTYGHVEIKADSENTTAITIDNTTTGGETDPAELAGKAFGISTKITCTTVHGEGGLHNVEDAGNPKKHTVTGKITVGYSNCTVSAPAKCVVSEPISFSAEFVGVEGLGSEGNTMGVEFKPEGGGKVFVGITFKNKGAEKCALNEKTVNVEETAIGTGTPNPKEKHSGSTIVFTDEMTTETLIFGGNKAGFDNTGTVRMKDGGPIALTTTT